MPGSPDRPIPLPPLLPQLDRCVEILRQEEADLLAWFREETERTEAQREQERELRLALLRTSYRLDASAHPRLEALKTDLRERFGIEQDIECYQDQTGLPRNVHLLRSDGAMHVVFAGPVLELCNDMELLAVLGHEIGHDLLGRRNDGLYATVHALLDALAEDAAAGVAYQSTAARYALSVEAYCDRVALVAAKGDLASTVRALLLMTTGSQDVDADAYLAQARELVAAGPAKRDSSTHPAPYLRVHALACFADGSVDENGIQELLLGHSAFRELDLLERASLRGHARDFVRYLRTGFDSDGGSLAELAEFYLRVTGEDEPGPNLAPEAPLTPSSVLPERVQEDEELAAYFAYVALDLACAEPDSREEVLAKALAAFRSRGSDKALHTIMKRELKLTKKVLEGVEKAAAEFESSEAGA